MTAIGLIMPILAAGSLTVALLVPFRDARRGERATLGGRTPIRSSFGTNDPVEHSNTTVPQIGRISRAIDAIGEKFVVLLGGRPRASTSTTTYDDDAGLAADAGSDDSFADRIAGLVSESTSTEVQSPSIQYDVAPAMGREVTDLRRNSESDASVIAESTNRASHEANPFELTDETLAKPLLSSQDERGSEGGTLLARDLPPPLTRLRLRPDSGAITWPMHLPMPHLGLNDRERRAMLADLERTAGPSHERALACAYREEDAIGRTVALRALARISTHGSFAILSDALNLGSDDERALAVDLLSCTDDRESLVPALQDRVDAIAARAALAYVRSNRRSEYEALLSPHVDKRRLETILALLGGILE